MRVFSLLLWLPLSGCALTSWFTSTSSEFQAPDPILLKARLAIEGAEKNNRPDHFAVLLGADTELRHRGNLSLAYQVLLEQGYPRDHIYILDSEGETPFFPLTDVTTRESVTMLFEHLAKVVEPQDTVFVYVTGHGRRITAEEESDGEKKELGVSTLILNPGEELAQDEFAKLLEKIEPGAGIAFFDQCYWGPLTSPKLCNYVVITTSQQEETSHGNTFPRAFWAAFRERKSTGVAPTIFDAFKFAMVADRATTLGLNKPRISHGCVSPSELTLLGIVREQNVEAASQP